LGEYGGKKSNSMPKLAATSCTTAQRWYRALSKMIVINCPG